MAAPGAATEQTQGGFWQTTGSFFRTVVSTSLHATAGLGNAISAVSRAALTVLDPEASKPEAPPKLPELRPSFYQSRRFSPRIRMSEEERQSALKWVQLLEKEIRSFKAGSPIASSMLSAESIEGVELLLEKNPEGFLKHCSQFYDHYLGLRPDAPPKEETGGAHETAMLKSLQILRELYAVACAFLIISLSDCREDRGAILKLSKLKNQTFEKIKADLGRQKELAIEACINGITRQTAALSLPSYANSVDERQWRAYLSSKQIPLFGSVETIDIQINKLEESLAKLISDRESCKKKQDESFQFIRQQANGRVTILCGQIATAEKQPESEDRTREINRLEAALQQEIDTEKDLQAKRNSDWQRVDSEFQLQIEKIRQQIAGLKNQKEELLASDEMFAKLEAELVDRMQAQEDFERSFLESQRALHKNAAPGSVQFDYKYKSAEAEAQFKEIADVCEKLKSLFSEPEEETELT